MRPQRLIATAMLVMSATLMAMTSRDIIYPAVLCLLGLVGLQRRFTWEIKPNQRIIQSWLLLVIAILLALHYRYSPHGIWMGQEQAIALAWQTVARYFLAAMVLILFLGSATQLPPSLGMFHIAITICTGQILLLDDLLIVFRSMEFTSVILVILYAATASRGGRQKAADGGPQTPQASAAHHPLSSSPAAAIILIIAANIGWIFGSLLYQHVEVLNYVPLWLARQGAIIEQMTGVVSSVGFTTSGRLSSMQTVLQDQDATVALTIESRNVPGYLRARAFVTYRPSEWHERGNAQLLYPAGSNPLSMVFGGRTFLFRVDDADYSALDYMTIHHDSTFQDAGFTPAGTVTLETSLQLLWLDSDDIVYTRNLPTGKGYRVGYTPRAFRHEPAGLQLRSMLALPNQLDPRITDLAMRIFTGCNTTAEKIDAVIRHFREHYTYSLSVDIPEDQDKLTYFLLSGSSGYCEYFASGAAILLRLAGVPTRYVTGFFVSQRGDQSGSWVARNMDAHAWAEAWDEERKSWTIVEATVQGGANTTPADTSPEQVDDSLRARLRRLTEAVYQYGVVGLISWLFTSYGMFAGSLALSVILGCILSWILIRWRRRRHQAGPGPSIPPAVIAMHRMLTRMDRKVRAMGLRRSPAETLHAFATRIASSRPGDSNLKRREDALRFAATWYSEYANLRYARSISSEQLQRLHNSAHLTSAHR
jgi:protein-glutamine gamma-glutamyltransferase